MTDIKKIPHYRKYTTNDIITEPSHTESRTFRIAHRRKHVAAPPLRPSPEVRQRRNTVFYEWQRGTRHTLPGAQQNRTVPLHGKKMSTTITNKIFNTRKFIHEIKIRDILWNRTSKSQLNREARKNAWEEIGKVFHPEWDDLSCAEKQQRGKIVLSLSCV